MAPAARRRERHLRVLDNAVSRAVDEVREDDYERLLAGLRAFVRRQGEQVAGADGRGGADITVPPPNLPLARAVDALFRERVRAARRASSERDERPERLAARRCRPAHR